MVLDLLEGLVDVPCHSVLLGNELANKGGVLLLSFLYDLLEADHLYQFDLSIIRLPVAKGATAASRFSSSTFHRGIWAESPRRRRLKARNERWKAPIPHSEGSIVSQIH